jgi:hypothetical protein
VARPDFLTLQDRSAEAGSLLGHKIFGESIAALKQSYSDQIAAVPLGQTDKLVALHTKLKLVDEIVGELKATVNAVRLAAKSQTEDL